MTKKMFTENGFLSEEGERVFSEIIDSKISTILKQAKNDDELRILESLLKNRIGEAVFNVMQAKREITAKFAAMTDEQFEAYLKAKYGEKHLFISLTPEELDRVPRLTREEVRGALSKGIKAAQEFYNSSPITHPWRRRFK